MANQFEPQKPVPPRTRNPAYKAPARKRNPAALKKYLESGVRYDSPGTISKKPRWSRITAAFGAAALVPTLVTGRIMPKARPLEPRQIAAAETMRTARASTGEKNVVRISVSKRMERPAPVLQQSPPFNVSSAVRQRWASMISLEVPHAPLEVREAVAASVIARSQKPGWKDKTIEKILNERHYQALGLPHQDKRLGGVADDYADNLELVDRLVADPAPAASAPTHFYMMTSVMPMKNGRPVVTLTSPPESWLKKGANQKVHTYKSPWGVEYKLFTCEMDS